MRKRLIFNFHASIRLLLYTLTNAQLTHEFIMILRHRQLRHQKRRPPLGAALISLFR
ncbi:hypothetical protein NBRC111894_2760 [Sporolactobacillus inulinus]|uniref:Uncharacterized protein n=1 Tax=Sporolactobacillus inulinus TaxID=2078 RepID=A0A4Y1ZDL6_9BACL|nr:hypothetical protein NBRC111894_2760 [Sporolactobacillus inulinus]